MNSGTALPSSRGRDNVSRLSELYTALNNDNNGGAAAADTSLRLPSADNNAEKNAVPVRNEPPPITAVTSPTTNNNNEDVSEPQPTSTPAQLKPTQPAASTILASRGAVSAADYLQHIGSLGAPISRQLAPVASASPEFCQVLLFTALGVLIVSLAHCCTLMGYRLAMARTAVTKTGEGGGSTV